MKTILPFLLAGLCTAMLHAEPREWTEQATGRKINAEFVTVDGDQVTLRVNGREVKLPVARLSEADQSYLKMVAVSPAPQADPVAPAKEAKSTAASSKVVGPIEIEGSHYFYYVPASVKPGKKVPLIFYTGSGGGSAGTVKKMIEGAEICGWIAACSVESKNSSDETMNPVHSERCVKHLIETQAVDPKRLYYTGNSGGARIAFINGKNLGSAGVLAFIAGAGEGELSKTNNYFIVSGATDYNRYETAATYDKVRKTSAYRMNPEGHSVGPAWLMTEGIVWLQASWNAKAGLMTPERSDFEAASLDWIEKMKQKEPYRAAWWARFFNVQGVSPVHKATFAGLDAELSRDPVNLAYIKGIADIEEFASSAMG
ncbi:MAG TPA: SHD1 domain-containing protein, partial [Luteolibacter sp.]|nr:SHD1 domain-containing protein [Luteolibacter sp.]